VIDIVESPGRGIDGGCEPSGQVTGLRRRRSVCGGHFDYARGFEEGLEIS